MNKQILNTYGVKFYLVDGDTVVTDSSVIKNLTSFLMSKDIVITNYLIGELNNALNGLPHIPQFESNGGVTLIIGQPNSIFEEGGPNYSDLSIPTADLKEIFMSYVDWLQSNNYEKYL